MVDRVAPGWQVVHLNRSSIVARHIRALRRLPVGVDLNDVLDLLVDVPVGIERGRQADPNPRHAVLGLQRHVREERRNRRVRLVFVGCLLELDVDLEPEFGSGGLVIVRRHMEVLGLDAPKGSHRTEQPSERH